MRHHHSPGIRGQLMWFLCCICLFLLALAWFLSTQLLEPLYTKHIEKQLTTQAESITAELDKAIANGESLSAWSFGHLTVNTYLIVILEIVTITVLDIKDAKINIDFNGNI